MEYAGKPRPAVVIQDDTFDQTASVTICMFTSDETDAPLIRLKVLPSEGNGLRRISRIMVDKIVTVPRTRMGECRGHLDDGDMRRLSHALLVFLGLAVSTPAPAGA